MDLDLDAIDAYSAGLAPADFVFVFGTAHPTPADIAADLFHRGLAPFVVLTGGENRGRPGLIESIIHRDRMLDAGVPEEELVLETESRNTQENVSKAAPLVEQRVRSPRAAIAVVKWYHRRGLIALGAGMPSLERIFVIDYEPPLGNGERVTRENWRSTAPRSIERELRYVGQLGKDGVDVLKRSDAGWIRSMVSA